MIYENTVAAIFISRPNRFIAEVLIDGNAEIAHVKNTGRCKELLLPGARVILQKFDSSKRKTQYDLIAVWKGKRLINIDSQAPNRVFYEHLLSGQYIENITRIKPEVKYGGSRFDFYVEAGERKIFIEVKGVTLEDDGVVLFPDAPTLRGVRHLNELAQCAREGYEAHVVFVIQMSDVLYFMPNNATHPTFGEALLAAQTTGVRVAALDCIVTDNSLRIGKAVPVKLEETLL
jgi:sugar fermentation stimulation protein A